MTKDELFDEFILFVGVPSTSIRSLSYWRVKNAFDKTSIIPEMAYGGFLHAFIHGIITIDVDVPIDDFDSRLRVLADELKTHLKAELS